jgi:hypothetical protein
VPFPASAFRLDVFKKTQVPFHSPTFSDTEQTLNMLAYGRFFSSQKETMFYRENSQSESHSLNPSEIVIGSGVALARVLNSTNFKLVLNRIDTRKREIFAQQLIKSLELRLPNSELLTTLQLNALEVMLQVWGYKQKNVAEILIKNYQKFASKQTVEVISRISRNGNYKFVSNHKTVSIEMNAVNKLWDKYFRLNLRFFGRYNKCFVKSIYKVVFLIKPNHRMKIKW